MPDDIKLKKYEEVLMAAFDFDTADLAANERGNYSEHQIAALHHQRRRYVVTGAIMAGLMLLFLAFVVLTSSQLAALFNGVAVLGLLLAAFSTGQHVYRLNRDLQTPVSAVEGRVELDARSVENGGDYVVQVEEQKFKVRREAFFAFKNGDPYRLYYAPHSQTILSVDWLRDDQPFVDHDRLHLEEEPRLQVTRMAAGTQVSRAGAARR